MKIFTIVLVVTIALFAFFATTLFFQNQKPKITPGLEDGKLREIPDKKNAVSTQTAYSDKLIEPFDFKNTLEESRESMKKALEAYGGIRIIEESENHIYAVAVTGTMRFRDDIEIYFDVSERKIHYRSASRAGYSDLGLNRKRFKEIAGAYDRL